MNADNLDVRLLRFRSRRDEPPHALAGALLEAGRASEAREVVRLALASGEQDARLFVIEGRAWFEQGDLPQAQASLMRAAKLNPRDKEPYRWLAQVLMKRGEPGRAVQVLERALAIDSSDKALQQAHMRAQRLARIAEDVELTSGEFAEVPPQPPRAPTERPPPGSASARPAPLPPAEVAARSAPFAPSRPIQRAPVDPGPTSQAPRPTVPMSSAEGRSSPGRTAAAGPLSSSRLQGGNFPGRLLEEDTSDDAPTAAFEMPDEIRNWLEAERSGEAKTVPPAPSEPLPSPVLELSKIRPPEGSEAGAAPPVAPAVDAAAGSSNVAPPSEAEPPEQVLELLAQQGIFEQGKTAAAPNWASKAEARPAGNRIGGTLAVTWVLALMAAGGGYYGWTRWVEGRRVEAKALIAQAVEAARDGEHASLLAAETKLGEARRLDAKSKEALEHLLFVQAARALEDGSGDLGYLRHTLARAEAAEVSGPVLAAGKALLFAVDRNSAAAQEHVALAVKEGANDPRVLYLVGRLHQRSGNEEARALLEQATAQDAELALAWAAQAELALRDGDRDKARELFEKALGPDQKFLHAELWRIVLEEGAQGARERKAQLDALRERIDAGSAADKLLAMVARARAERLLERPDDARAALEGAGALTVANPELMLWLSQEAAVLGLHDLAYRAAHAASKAAPQVRRYRDNLANVLLRRGDGRAVLSAIAASDADDESSWVLLTRARAALLTGSRDALDEAKKALAQYRSTPQGRDDVDAGALLLRADLRLGANAESLLPAARALVQQAKDSASAQVALGEAALLARQAELAERSLERAHQLNPEDAEALYLLGRARRLAGKPAEAEAALEQALALSPSHLHAREAMGGLLVDAGEYARALQLFEGLEREGVSSAVLGKVEALLGQGEVAQAEAQLGKLSPELAESPAAQLLRARLSLAKGKAGEAVKILQPLVAEDSELRTADVLSVYGEALYQNDRVDSAAGIFDAALELDPKHPDALIGRAMAAVRAEKAADAKGWLTRAKSALDTRVRPPRLRALLLVTWAKAEILEQSFDSARAKLTEAVEIPGAPAEAHFWLGETLAKAKSPRASESYAKYLELEPQGYYASRAKKALSPR